MTTGQEPELEVMETDDEVLFGGGHQADNTDVRCFGQAEMVDSGGTEKDAEDGNVLEPRGRHKRTVIDVAKEGMKLIGATEEDAEESFRWE